jgi:hypothetical protein
MQKSLGRDAVDLAMSRRAVGVTGFHSRRRVACTRWPRLSWYSISAEARYMSWLALGV